MRLLAAGMTCLLAVSLAAAQSPKESRKSETKPAAASAEPKRVRTIPLDPDGNVRAEAKDSAQKAGGQEPSPAKPAAQAKPEPKGARKVERKVEKNESSAKVSKEIA